MILVSVILIVALTILILLSRFYFSSFFIYLSTRFERRRKNLQLLSSLRENLVHERKKKMAGSGMILASWEKGEEIQKRYEDFKDLLSQLKGLVLEEKRNLMAVTRDIFLWGKLWSMLRRIEKISTQRREKLDVAKLRKNLRGFQNLIEEVVEVATKEFSFTLNEVIKESVKIVRIEKAKVNIKIEENLEDVGNVIRFPYDRFNDWKKILGNLLRNAVEAVEARLHGAGRVVIEHGLPGGDKIYKVKVITKRKGPNSASIIIEDSGIGMDEATKSSFYKTGFTSGKKDGSGMGVTEKTVDFINQYGNWEIESQKGAGTKITINIDRKKARKANLLLPQPKPFHRTKLAFGLSLLLLALIGLTLLFVFDPYSRFWVDWNPAYAKVEKGKEMVVFNANGKELWRHEFESGIFFKTDKFENKFPLIQTQDLDRDGWNETLVTTPIGIQTSGQLFCLDYKGNMKWVFTAGQGFKEGSIVERENSKSELFSIKNFLVDDFVKGAEKEILVISRLAAFFPCQLAMINHSGRVIGEYWHPGDIRFAVFTDLNEDGEKELLCAGINNRLNWRSVVFILDVKELVGKQQGPPYHIFGNLKPAREEKYVVFPHIKDVSWNWVEVSPIKTPELFYVRPEHILLKLDDGRHYFLAKNLEYMGCEHRMSDFAVWKAKIDFPYRLNREKDSLNWKNFEVWESCVRIK